MTGMLTACGLSPTSGPSPGGPEAARPPEPPPPSGSRPEPGPGARISPRFLPREVLARARRPHTSYSPLVEFEVEGFVYSPRAPGATVAYLPGSDPLPPEKRGLFRLAVDSLNRAAGTTVFALLPDGASADVPVMESADFPGPTVFGATTFKLVTKIEEGTVVIDHREEVRLRPNLPGRLFFKVALHELGHAAGLDHNPDPGSLMNARTTFDTPDDFVPSEKESLRLLYALPMSVPFSLSSTGRLAGIGAR